ncbi:TPR-like protein [Calocera viscosa TUFC12733]|uniref:TPR-like protein n=1 Tax=Calocera viscosa (strain TUFC12733) TaxID=1330018 RepID=A0A167LT18_CALVF|nr:TPR-like protein [Calocera viscosa TUFC12733]
MPPARPASPAESSDSFRSAQEDISDHFTDSEIRALLDEATGLKEEGNAHFRAGRWEAAREKYEQALRTVPKRDEPPPRPSSNDDEPEGVPPYVEDPPEEEAEEEILSPASLANGSPNGSGKGKEPAEPPLARESRLARAVLRNNVAACFVKVGEPKKAVEACTEALKDDPGYVKALHRRALSGREVGSWSALSTAQEDLKKLIDILPPGSPLLPGVRATLAQVEPQLAAAAQKEKDEMMSKLKDLGNTFLGRFGLSTDNFKFEPDGKGGYGMNFQR